MRTTLFYIAFFLCIKAFSSNATFVFTSTKIKIDSSFVAYYNSLQITVNNIKLSSQEKQYKVAIHKTLDTIKIKSTIRFKEDQIILAKLKPGVIYRIVFNPCSTLEIIPSEKSEELQLVRFVSVNKGDSKLHLNSYECFIDAKQIWSRDTTDYFVKGSSGLCPYALSSFHMCSKSVGDIVDENDPKECKGIKLYFSGQEMFTLFYDYKTNRLTAKFDGYYNKRENVKIGITSD